MDSVFDPIRVTWDAVMGFMLAYPSIAGLIIAILVIVLITADRPRDEL